MSFPPKLRKEALIRSRRCCCVCRQFGGRNIEVHHVVPESEGGSNELENAIVLCLRCHAEAGHYNPLHPIGNKYSPEELRKHRDKWWKWCEDNPEAPLPEDPISISPGVINLGTGEWKTHSVFKVHNKTNEQFFQVYIKILINNKDINPEDIHIDYPKAKDEIYSDLGDIRAYADLVIYKGINEPGYGIIILLLASLDPGELYTFILRNYSKVSSSQVSDPKAILKVEEYSSEPAPIKVGSKGEISELFKAFEKMKIISYRIHMERTR